MSGAAGDHWKEEIVKNFVIRDPDGSKFDINPKDITLLDNLGAFFVKGVGAGSYVVVRNVER